MATHRALILGTRGSRLALVQTGLVRDALAAPCAAAGLEVRVEIIETAGDTSPGALVEMGGQGVFTRQIEAALIDGRVDLAVHSLKDLPTAMAPDLALVATPARQDVRDTLVMNAGATVDDLAANATVGTGSPRRQGQLSALRPDLRFTAVRGNVDTRLGKVRTGEVDAVVLAAAGLHRLGLQDQIAGYLDTDQVLPAPGQGALGLQMRAGDERRDLVAGLNHAATWLAALAERSCLATLGAGCHAPVAAWGRQVSDELRLDGLVARPDGTDLHRLSQTASLAGDDLEARAADLGRAVADELLGAGAAAILRDGEA